MVARHLTLRSTTTNMFDYFRLIKVTTFTYIEFSFNNFKYFSQKIVDNHPKSVHNPVYNLNKPVINLSLSCFKLFILSSDQNLHS